MSIDRVCDAASSKPVTGGKKRVGSIDALRTVMCVGIALNHFVPYFFGNGDVELHVSSYFSYFTDIFAVLAGLFAFPYLKREWSRRTYYDFIVARTGRLYPLHFVTMAFYVLLAVPIHLGITTPENVDRYTLDALIPHITLTHAWGLGPAMAFNYPSWMTSAIFGCYLILPLLSMAHRTSRRSMAPLLVVAVAAAAACAWMLDSEITRLQREGLGILRALPSFLFGMLLGQLRLSCPSKAGSSLLVVAALLMAFGPSEPLEGVARLVVLYLLVYAVLLLDSSGLKTPLQLRWLQAGAAFSFGVYLWHGLVATVLFRIALPETLDANLLRLGNDSPLLAYCLIASGVGAAFLLAAISLRTIERYGGEFFVRAFSRTRPTAGADERC
jgi:peptidoglycan/LPS O-acetylase OafA/YrhL